MATPAYPTSPLVQPSKSSITRIAKDLTELRAMGADPHNPSIYVKYNDQNLSTIYVMIVGAMETPYANCPLFFTIQPNQNYNSATFTSYPAQSP